MLHKGNQSAAYGVMGPCYISVSTSWSTHTVHTLIVSSNHSGLLVSLAAVKEKERERERERERVLIVTIMEVVPHYTRNLSSDVNGFSLMKGHNFLKKLLRTLYKDDLILLSTQERLFFLRNK